jgi:hypothetical protein
MPQSVPSFREVRHLLRFGAGRIFFAPEPSGAPRFRPSIFRLAAEEA